MIQSTKDPFGFRFWLAWILGFALSFVASAGLWTLFLTKLFGEIRGAELTVTWSAAVFGTWFLFVTPFMRKKERIWKRLNQDQEKAADLWLRGSSLLIGALLAALVFWSLVFQHELHRQSGGFFGPWLKAVAATWIVTLIPFLILMYRKADVVFREAEARQTQRGPVFKAIFVEKAKRILPEDVQAAIKASPETLSGGHVVLLTLMDGREIPHVFVLQSREILGLYARPGMDFSAAEIRSAQVLTQDELPPYDEAQWLRLDGRA